MYHSFVVHNTTQLEIQKARYETWNLSVMAQDDDDHKYMSMISITAHSAVKYWESIMRRQGMTKQRNYSHHSE